MTLTKEQIDSFKIACRPVHDWLEANAHPETVVVIEAGQATVSENMARAVYPVKD